MPHLRPGNVTTALPRQAQGCSRPDCPNLVEEYVLPKEIGPALQITHMEVSHPPRVNILPRERGILSHGQRHSPCSCDIESTSLIPPLLQEDESVKKGSSHNHCLSSGSLRVPLGTCHLSPSVTAETLRYKYGSPLARITSMWL